MVETLRVSRKDLTSDKILEELDDGNRVVIEIDLLGKTMRMAIRERSGTYYCDTPVKLLTYETRDEMRICLERYKLARSSADNDADEDIEPKRV